MNVIQKRIRITKKNSVKFFDTPSYNALTIECAKPILLGFRVAQEAANGKEILFVVATNILVEQSISLNVVCIKLCCPSYINRNLVQAETRPRLFSLGGDNKPKCSRLRSGCKVRGVAGEVGCAHAHPLGTDVIDCDSGKIKVSRELAVALGGGGWEPRPKNEASTPSALVQQSVESSATASAGRTRRVGAGARASEQNLDLQKKRRPLLCTEGIKRESEEKRRRRAQLPWIRAPVHVHVGVKDESTLWRSRTKGYGVGAMRARE